MLTAPRLEVRLDRCEHPAPIFTDFTERSLQHVPITDTTFSSLGIPDINVPSRFHDRTPVHFGDIGQTRLRCLGDGRDLRFRCLLYRVCYLF